MKAKAWAQAHGVPVGTLSSWCAHYARWQARLDGGGDAGTGAAPSSTRASGFVAARVAPPGAGGSVRIELNTGNTRLELHWPLTHRAELLALLKELGR
jgi:hypothetical protein